MSWDDHWKGRKVLIVTMHGKEKAIAPVLRSEFDMQISVSDEFNTDVFGTFTGEVQRRGSSLETLRMKCEAAMVQYGFDLAIASEGSFGPHPEFFFSPADLEQLLLIDQYAGIEIEVSRLTTQTNFSSQNVVSLQDLMNFSQRVGFPSHAIHLKIDSGSSLSMIKGIRDEQTLISSYEVLAEQGGLLTAETDMRAMNNPTRMNVIGELMQAMAEKMKRRCPTCGTPGFGVIRYDKGLPCGVCRSPTRSTLSMTEQCQRCRHENIVFFPNGREKEDPMYCDICNP